jgi:hypothetical protein
LLRCTILQVTQEARLETHQALGDGQQYRSGVGSIVLFDIHLGVAPSMDDYRHVSSHAFLPTFFCVLFAMKSVPFAITMKFTKFCC